MQLAKKKDKTIYKTLHKIKDRATRTHRGELTCSGIVGSARTSSDMEIVLDNNICK